jgi:hypothetical protein
MAVGIRCNKVYFLHSPTPAQVLAKLQEVTGLMVGVAAQQEEYLEVFHPALPARRIAMGWSQDRLGNWQRIRDVVPGLSEPPFSTLPHCVELWLDHSSARSYQYLESALLFVLRGFGGQIKRPGPRDHWVGKKWADLPPLGMWEAIADKWK